MNVGSTHGMQCEVEIPSMLRLSTHRPKLVCLVGVFPSNKVINNYQLVFVRRSKTNPNFYCPLEQVRVQAYDIMFCRLLGCGFYMLCKTVLWRISNCWLCLLPSMVLS